MKKIIIIAVVGMFLTSCASNQFGCPYTDNLEITPKEKEMESMSTIEQET